MGYSDNSSVGTVYPSMEAFVQAKHGKRPIRRLLIANNGIAAVKAIRSIRKWAYETFENDRIISFVVMATPEDLAANAEYIRMADQSIEVPGGANNNNFANVTRIVEIAEAAEVDAVWAGWGHASENPSLPERLARSGILFLGPSAGPMKSLGDKIDATLIAQSAQVPTLPWNGSDVTIDVAALRDANGSVIIPKSVYDSVTIHSIEEAREACRRLQFPLMIKASEGGGGKGIRTLYNEGELESAWNAVRLEVPGSPIFLMRLAERCRHLEVQLLADHYGHVIALSGRDCSVQRRHQKIIEEGPPLTPSVEVWNAMQLAAIRLAKLVGYSNAGTVEYLYMPDNTFSFLELNPRLQVEHPVTEMITNVNLPAAQLQIAMGIPLYSIGDIRRLYGADEEGTDPIDFDAEAPVPAKGHVIACRITAENPEKGFQPTSGAIRELNFRSTANVWGYFSVDGNGRVHEYADSQFGHLFSWGSSRDIARKNMVQALREFSIRGEIMTPIAYLLQLLQSDRYVHNAIDTNWLDGLIGSQLPMMKPDACFVAMVAAACHAFTCFTTNKREYCDALRRGQIPPCELLSVSREETLVYEDVKYQFQAFQSGEDMITLGANGSLAELQVKTLPDGGFLLRANDQSHVAYLQEMTMGLRLSLDGITCLFSREWDPAVLRAESGGKLVRYLVHVGDHVSRGEVFAEMEVMKMYLPLRAQESGKVTHLTHSPGSMVQGGEIVGSLQLDDASHAHPLACFSLPLPCLLSHPPRHVQQRVRESLRSLIACLDGYWTKRDQANIALKTLLTAVKEPALAFADFDDVLSTMETKLTEEMKRDLHQVIHDHGTFPADKLRQVVRKHTLYDSSLQATLSPLIEVINRYDNPPGSFIVDCLFSLLDRFLADETPTEFKNDDYSLQRHWRRAFRHQRSEGLGDLLPHLLDLLSAHVPRSHGESSRLTSLLQQVGKLSIPAGVALEARQLLLERSLPSREEELAGTLAALREAVGTPGCRGDVMRRLVGQREDVCGALMGVMRSEKGALRGAAVECYLRKIYAAYVLGEVRGWGETGFRFRFSLEPVELPVGAKVMCEGDGDDENGYEDDGGDDGGDYENGYENDKDCDDDGYDEDCGEDDYESSDESIDCDGDDDYESMDESMEGDDENDCDNDESVDDSFNHSITQPIIHSSQSNQSITQPINQPINQPITHSNQPITQPITHSNQSINPSITQPIINPINPLHSTDQPYDSLITSSSTNSAEGAILLTSSLASLQTHLPTLLASFPPSPRPRNALHILLRHPPATHLRRHYARFLQRQRNALRQAAIARVTFTETTATHPLGTRWPLPSSFTFTSSRHFAEDPLVRHIEPPLAHHLQLSRLRHFAVRLVPLPDRSIHLYEATPRGPLPHPKRFFVRAVCTSFDPLDTVSLSDSYPSAEKTLVEALDALEMGLGQARLRGEEEFGGNHIFLNILPAASVKPELIEQIMRSLYGRYVGRLKQLQVARVEMRLLAVLTPGSAPMPVRMVGQDPTGLALRIDTYVETRDRGSGEVIFTAINDDGNEVWEEGEGDGGENGGNGVSGGDDDGDDSGGNGGNGVASRNVVHDGENGVNGVVGHHSENDMAVHGVIQGCENSVNGGNGMVAHDDNSMVNNDGDHHGDDTRGKGVNDHGVNRAETDGWSVNDVSKDMNVKTGSATVDNRLHDTTEAFPTHNKTNMTRSEANKLTYSISETNTINEVINTVSKTNNKPNTINETNHTNHIINETINTINTTTPAEWDGLPVNTPYPPLEPLERERAAARRSSGTLYCYDFLDLIQHALRRRWTVFLRRSGLSPRSMPGTLMKATELELCEKEGGYDLRAVARAPGKNAIGMVAWHVTLFTPTYPTTGRDLLVVCNDITHKAGSFGTKEDLFFHLVSQRARALGIPRIFFAANSGARIGLAEEVKKRFRVKWVRENDPASGVEFLYLTEEDYRAIATSVVATPSLLYGATVYRLQAIIGAAGDLGVENLSGSGLIAGETRRAYKEIFTLTVVTGRSVGIGAYLVRLGQRTIQKAQKAPIILTGFEALNQLMGRPVYSSNDQLGGPAIMCPNGVTHLCVDNDREAVEAALRWLSYVPRTNRDIPAPQPLAPCDDSIDRPVTFQPSPVAYDVRSLIAGCEDADGTWKSGLFDRDSFMEILGEWAKTVVVGRARLGGIPVGVVATENRTVEAIAPADPAMPQSEEKVVQQAGGVWYPDSAFKTAQAIEDINQEGLPLFILANWRGFSGGAHDMFEEVLKFGSAIVDQLVDFKQPVFVYIPPLAELRGGAFVVVDSNIHASVMEMYADPRARAGVLEPTGVVAIKFREGDRRAAMRRNDLVLETLLRTREDAALDEEQKADVERQVAAREKALRTPFQQVAEAFADLHDRAERMEAVGVIRQIVPLSRARGFFYWRLRRRLLEVRIAREVCEAAHCSMERAEEYIEEWFRQGSRGGGEHCNGGSGKEWNGDDGKEWNKTDEQDYGNNADQRHKSNMERTNGSSNNHHDWDNDAMVARWLEKERTQFIHARIAALSKQTIRNQIMDLGSKNPEMVAESVLDLLATLPGEVRERVVSTLKRGTQLQSQVQTDYCKEEQLVDF